MKEQSKDYQDLLGAVRGIATIHALLNEGTYPGFKSQIVAQAIKFAETLHAEALAELQTHPEHEEIKETCDAQS